MNPIDLVVVGRPGRIELAFSVSAPTSTRCDVRAGDDGFPTTSEDGALLVSIDTSAGGTFAHVDAPLARDTERFYAVLCTNGLDYDESVVEGANAGSAIATAPWWNDGWSHRRRIALLNASRAENLDAFPVALEHRVDNFDFAQAHPDGDDIRFVDDDGVTELDYEIERWSSGTFGDVWVRVPRIDASSDDDGFFMYWGNASAASESDAPAVFADLYTSVHHFGDDFADATGHGHTGQSSAPGAPAFVDGIIGRSAQFDGIDDRVLLQSELPFDFLTSFTVGVWVQCANFTEQWETFVAKGDYAWRLQRWDQNDGAELGFTTVPFNQAGARDDDVQIDDGTWHHVVGTYDGTFVRLYVDGVSRDAVPYTGALNNTTGQVGFGFQNDLFARFFAGQLDEVRLGSTARSAAWVDAEHATGRREIAVFGDVEER